MLRNMPKKRMRNVFGNSRGHSFWAYCVGCYFDNIARLAGLLSLQLALDIRAKVKRRFVSVYILIFLRERSQKSCQESRYSAF